MNRSESDVSNNENGEYFIEQQSPFNKNIYMVMDGGLGNQLFQAAFSICLREELNARINFVISKFYEDGFLETFKLCSFQNIRATIAPPSDCEGAPIVTEEFLRKFSVDSWFGPLLYRINESKRLVFRGYWQDEKYFIKYRDIICKTLQPQIPNSARSTINSISSSDVIGVHVRRCCYTQLGVAKPQYYKMAIEEIRGAVGDIPVLIFTDDIHFCRFMFNDLYQIKNISYFGNQDINNPIVDFCALSACKHHVISNSSFSWWAAWLNEKPESINYAPEPWIITDPLTKPAPSRWHKIPDSILSPFG